MSTEQNKQLILRWRDEIWNKHNVDIIDELHASDYVGHYAGLPAPIRGRGELKQLFAAYLAAFDIHYTPEFLVAEGDRVVVYDHGWLKHTGTFQGMPPTGKEAVSTSTDIYRIAEGRIAEQWFEMDLTGMMLQLGLAPTAGAPGSRWPVPGQLMALQPNDFVLATRSRHEGHGPQETGH